MNGFNGFINEPKVLNEAEYAIGFFYCKNGGVEWRVGWSKEPLPEEIGDNWL